MGIVIKNIEQLKEICHKEELVDCYIQLNGGLKSSKYISYDGDTFYVQHCIDDTEEHLTEMELLNSNIGEAMKLNSLIQY